MKYIHCFIATIAMALLLFACNNGSNSLADSVSNKSELETLQNANSEKEEKQKVEDDQTATADTSSTVSQNFGNTNAPSKGSNPDWDKKIIKTADIELELNDFKKFNSSIHSTLKQFGAYLATEKQAQDDYKIANNVTIKVPVDQFDNLVNALSVTDAKLINKNISSNDVTTEAIDTKARMQAKMAVRDKYMQLLKQARNMNEILQVQSEINDIQEDIEAAGSRLNYLQHSSAFSTINLIYYQYLNGSNADNSKPDFFRKFIKAFSTGTTLVGYLLLVCISIWPFILCALIAWIYFRRFRIKKA